MNIFVGNLDYTTSVNAIRKRFESFGSVTSVKIVMDHETGRSRGFAFVEMANDAEARAAIRALNGSDIEGRTMKVSEARARTDRRTGGRPTGGRL
jgi:RNA recognition motif-containing protein